MANSYLLLPNCAWTFPWSLGRTFIVRQMGGGIHQPWCHFLRLTPVSVLPDVPRESLVKKVR